tara:strand:- start:549 stop:935 length:387 start_codon:yes stop_codon:yes gene_type:complete
MKKLKHLKKLSGIIDEYTSELQSEIAQIKKEHQKQILLANTKLISEIAKGENIDELSLIDKYLKKSKKKKDSKKSEKEIQSRKEELLNHLNYDGKDYFYENKSNGAVYDENSNKVGVFNCGSINFTTN